MFIDQLSYSLICKNNISNFKFHKLTPKHQNIVLYKSDCSGFWATHYNIQIFKDNTYILHSKQQYTNNNNNKSSRIKNIGINAYIQMLKNQNYIICISNLNEVLQYPFKYVDSEKHLMKNTPEDSGKLIIAHDLNLYTYSVPVDDIFTCIKIDDELEYILKYYGFQKIKKSNFNKSHDKNIDDLVAYINSTSKIKKIN